MTHPHLPWHVQRRHHALQPLQRLGQPRRLRRGQRHRHPSPLPLPLLPIGGRDGGGRLATLLVPIGGGGEGAEEFAEGVEAGLEEGVFDQGGAVAGDAQRLFEWGGGDVCVCVCV